MSRYSDVPTHPLTHHVACLPRRQERGSVDDLRVVALAGQPRSLPPSWQARTLCIVAAGFTMLWLCLQK
jgi:hypothetical protein